MMIDERDVISGQTGTTKSTLKANPGSAVYATIIVI